MVVNHLQNGMILQVWPYIWKIFGGNMTHVPHLCWFAVCTPNISQLIMLSLDQYYPCLLNWAATFWDVHGTEYINGF